MKNMRRITKGSLVKRRLKSAFIGMCGVCMSAMAMADSPKEVEQVLDALHSSAAKADGNLYFSLFSKDAVFIGTDATERWSLAAFRSFAKPWFDQGKG